MWQLVLFWLSMLIVLVGLLALREHHKRKTSWYWVDQAQDDAAQLDYLDEWAAEHPKKAQGHTDPT